MSVYFDLMVNQHKAATVSVRQVRTAPKDLTIYSYEITSGTDKPVRGTVEYYGPEDLSLIAAVLSDLTATGKNTGFKL